MGEKTPELKAILIKNGIDEKIINKMDFEEFQSYVVALGESYGRSFEEIKSNVESKKKVTINPTGPYQERATVSNDEFIYRQIRKVKSDDEIMEERNMRSSIQLLKNRQKLVKTLIIDEEKRYSDSVQQMYKNLPPQQVGGFHIAVILHNGVRINRNFPRDDKIENVYIWVAANDNVLKDQIKLGSFILIDIDGNEKDPNVQLSNVISENRVLWFVRLI